ncbi:MAG: ATP-binding cassette domain-containing protein [Magnetococcales bacterium]|nr:ATP-binding cassette domain-containing protein [Magnetococcales bacterium]
MQQFAEERQRYHQRPTASVAIRFDGVEKTLDGRKVLDGVDLVIPSGKITAIIGMSGGGKSVTLKHIVGLMQPDRGEVWIGAQRLGQLSGRRLNQLRQRFSMMFQSSALFDSLNVLDNVAFPLRERRLLDESMIMARVERALSQVSLTGMGHKFPDELSGGMMKRVALARALVTEPEFLLLDEPTAGLDPIIEHSIHALVCATYLRTRYTTVMISHAVPEIFRWCHHVIVLHQGKVLAAGSSMAITETEHPVVRQFIRGELQGPIKII